MVEKQLWRDTFNIGGTESISINELAVKIIEISKSSSDIVYTDPQDLFKGQFVEIPQRVPDVSYLNKKIGIVPGTSLSVMLDKFNQFYKQKVSDPLNDLSSFSGQSYNFLFSNVSGLASSIFC